MMRPPLNIVEAAAILYARLDDTVLTFQISFQNKPPNNYSMDRIYDCWTKVAEHENKTNATRKRVVSEFEKIFSAVLCVSLRPLCLSCL
jgi:hypothetical protein